MKNVSLRWLFAAALIFCFSQSYSQDGNDGNVFYMQTFYIGFVEGGSTAEFDSLTSLLTTNVLNKRDKIISQRMMSHLWGSDSRQFIVVREFANMNDLHAYTDEDTSELFNAYWDTEEKRDAFSEAYSKYFGGRHSDEIYQEIPAGRR